MMRLIDFIDLLEATDNLSRWFGDSKVVDADGNPLTLYHGTGGDFNTFKGMVWASTGTELPSEYASMRQDVDDGSANVMPLYMRIENPFNADYLSKTVTIADVFNGMLEQSGINLNNIPDNIAGTIRKNWDLVNAGRREEESGPHYNRHDFWLNPSNLFGTEGSEAIRESFLLLGFDGVKMIEGGELTYGAFSPNQVKSVYNKGEYDSNNPNVSETVRDKDMRLIDLIEAPIGDYAEIGNWGDQEKSNSFNHAQDRKMIQSENLIKKVRQKFGNTEHVLNFYFVNLPGVRKNAEHGFMTPEQVSETMPEAWKLIQQREQEQGTDANESINVIFVGNAGANRVAMTAWIMAHRIGHALKMTKSWKDYLDDFTRSIQDIFENVYDIKVRRNGYGGFDGIDDLELSRFFEAIGGMASARNGKLGGRPFEFYYEMFAQHITTGKLTFRELPKTFGSKNRTYRAVDEETRLYYSDDITSDGYSIADQWGDRIDNVLYEATGRYVIM